MDRTLLRKVQLTQLEIAREIKRVCKENDIGLKQSNLFDLTFDFIQETMSPIIIILEDFTDICLNAPESFLVIFNSLIQMAKYYNIYIIGCFYPEDNGKCNGQSFYDAFMSKSFIMLFGGQLNQQMLTTLPRDLKDVNQKGQYNHCIVKYLNKFYGVLMPCGILKTIIKDVDDMPIFD